MKPPNNSRSVLTWQKDGNDNEGWVLDCYVNDSWVNAYNWDCEVLYWQEMPPKRNAKKHLPPCDIHGRDCGTCSWFKKCPLA